MLMENPAGRTLWWLSGSWVKHAVAVVRGKSERWWSPPCWPCWSSLPGQYLATGPPPSLSTLLIWRSPGGHIICRISYSSLPFKDTSYERTWEGAIKHPGLETCLDLTKVEILLSFFSLPTFHSVKFTFIQFSLQPLYSFFWCVNKSFTILMNISFWIVLIQHLTSMTKWGRITNTCQMCLEGPVCFNYILFYTDIYIGTISANIDVNIGQYCQNIYVKIVTLLTVLTFQERACDSQLQSQWWTWAYGGLVQGAHWSLNSNSKWI